MFRKDGKRWGSLLVATSRVGETWSRLNRPPRRSRRPRRAERARRAARTAHAHARAARTDSAALHNRRDKSSPRSPISHESVSRSKCVHFEPISLFLMTIALYFYLPTAIASYAVKHRMIAAKAWTSAPWQPSLLFKCPFSEGDSKALSYPKYFTLGGARRL